MSALFQIRRSPTPYGYAPARVVRDYTHHIELSEERVLVFNLLTGLGWKGPRHELVAGATRVEQGRGDVSAERILDALEAQYQQLAHPVSFQLIPTYGCNFSCAYCYEGSLTSGQKVWDRGEVSAVADAVARLMRGSPTPIADAMFTVLGGEVIREGMFEPVEWLVEALRGIGARRFEAITNGYELAAHVPAMKRLGIGQVQITVDGPQRIHDKRRPVRGESRASSFERILAGVAACLEAGMAVNLRVNVDQRNIPHLGELADTFAAQGWFDAPRFLGYLAPLERDHAGRMHFVPEDEMARMLVDVARESPAVLRFRWDLHGLDYVYALRDGRPPSMKMRYCGATRADYMLDARGAVYSCWFGAGREAFKIADIQAIAAGADVPLDGARRLHRWRQRGPVNMPSCRTCKWALVCGGGCSFKAAVKTGDMEAPNCAPFEQIYAAAGRVIYEHA